MPEINYLKYYWLEKYLFEDVRKNFNKNGCLTPEEFFAIVIWKRNASKTQIIRGFKNSSQSISSITKEVYKSDKKMETLRKIKGVGIAIASAILTVLYPDDFTVIDYRVLNSLKNKGVKIFGKPTEKIKDYNEYVKICKKESKRLGISLRNFDRTLWAENFYEELKRLVKGLR